MHHVKESSRKRPEREIGRGKAEAHEFEPLEREESSFARGKRSTQHGESKFGTSMVSQPAAGNSLRKERGSSLRKAEARIPHISNSRYSEKIFKNIKKCESCRSCTTSGDPSTQNQHIDLGNVYVGIDEGSDSHRIR